MAIKQSAIEPHWNYLLAIERDLEVVARYVEFDERNFACFSIEIARVLLAAGAETDVVCRQICKTLNGSSNADNIHQYRQEITAAFPRMASFGVRVERFGLELKPWDQWQQPDGVPFWWTAYNKIKHERRDEYHQANLHNALNAVAGLFVAVLHLYPQKAEQGRLLPSPQLLRPEGEHFGGQTHDGFEFGISYVLHGRTQATSRGSEAR